MRKATRITAAALGVVAGIAGLEHGYFEILQGDAEPVSRIFFCFDGATLRSGRNMAASS